MSVRSLKQFSDDLRRLRTSVGHRVARECATAITAIAQGTYQAGTDPYGVPWAPGAEGQSVDLIDTGAMLRGVAYVAIGNKLRVKLTVPYARYQVGKRNVTPAQGAALPVDYADTIRDTAVRVIREEMHLS